MEHLEVSRGQDAAIGGYIELVKDSFDVKTVIGKLHLYLYHFQLLSITYQHNSLMLFSFTQYISDCNK